MKNIILSILGICILTTIFLLENRSFFIQYLENKSGLEQYNLQKYSDSQEIFSGSLSKNPNQIVAFNLANSFVKQAENEGITQKKIDLFTQSLEYYNQAIEFSDQNYIQNNIKYVEAELEKYRNSQDDSSNQNQSEGGSGQGESQGEKQENSDQNIQENGGENGGENSENSSLEESGENNSTQDSSIDNALTQEQIEELENYSKQLEDIEKNNQQFFNKNTPEENLFEKFSNDPFFQDEFNRGGEKDW